jgi:hypothetical protein
MSDTGAPKMLVVHINRHFERPANARLSVSCGHKLQTLLDAAIKQLLPSFYAYLDARCGLFIENEEVNYDAVLTEDAATASQTTPWQLHCTAISIATEHGTAPTLRIIEPKFCFGKMFASWEHIINAIIPMYPTNPSPVDCDPAICDCAAITGSLPDADESGTATTVVPCPHVLDVFKQLEHVRSAATHIQRSAQGGWQALKNQIPILVCYRRGCTVTDLTTIPLEEHLYDLDSSSMAEQTIHIYAKTSSTDPSGFMYEHLEKPEGADE